MAAKAAFSVSGNLAAYGTAHAAVDAACAAVVLSLVAVNPFSLDAAALIIAYNVLAFAFQAPLGFIVDCSQKPVAAALMGIVLVAASALILPFNSLLAVALAGVGNALFHVGGGTVSLSLSPGKAGPPGIFVAPGALGLFIGALAVTAGVPLFWLICALAVSFAVIAFTKPPAFPYGESGRSLRPRTPRNAVELSLLLILFAIALRSLVGLVLVLPWKVDFWLGVAAVTAIFFGKALGGVLADRFGWLRVAVGALIASTPLLSFGAYNPVAGLAGLFLFNMTMPVTLAATARALPRWPGFAFGLTCLALIIGAFLPFAGAKPAFAGPLVLFAAILVSAVALHLALRRAEPSEWR